MRMLRHKLTGRLYTYQAGLATAENIEEVDVEIEQVEPAPPILVEQTPIPDAPKSLDEMTRDELIAMAEGEERQRGDNRNLSRMKKADLIAYITGEGA